DLSGDAAYDPSGLMTSAADLWEANPDFAAAETTRIQHIMIDDFQDATPAIHRLVKLLGTERDIVMTANPDTTVQGFRGARPQALVDWPQNLSSDAIVTTWRLGTACPHNCTPRTSVPPEESPRSPVYLMHGPHSSRRATQARWRYIVWHLRCKNTCSS